MIAISPDCQTAKVRRVCGCINIIEARSGTCKGGGSFRTPSKLRFLRRLSLGPCPECRAAMESAPVAVWHSL